MSVQRRQSRSGLRYDVRYRDRAGRVVTKTLRTKRDAEAFAADQHTALRNGVWIAFRLGDRKFVDVAAERLALNPPSGRQHGLVAEANDVPRHHGRAVGGGSTTARVPPTGQGWKGRVVRKRRFGTIRRLPSKRGLVRRATQGRG